MVEHTFICDGCGFKVWDTNTKGVHVCPECGKDMRWDLHFNGGQTGDFNKVSQSLAISPTQKAEHERMFPDVKVHDNGCLEFNDIKKYDDYMDKTGFVKRPQKIRKKGKRIS